MSTTDTANKATASEKSAEKTSARTQVEPVLQVERRDFVDLVPENRARVQPMRGFDPCYTILLITLCVAPTRFGMSVMSD